MKYKYCLYVLGLFMSLLVGCSDEEYAIPGVDSGLQNDALKRSLGPNIVGLDMEFVYAMALLPEEGNILSASVVASIPGAAGTYIEHRSFHTDGSGADIGVEIGDASVTNGNTTTVTFNRDTSAASLRYYYRIPEEARGRSVSFTFSATASNGQTVSYVLGPYEIRRMDIQLDLMATDGAACYISIADMAVYDAAFAAANPDKIDLVYLYRSITGITFNHALVAPSANADYLPGISLPGNLNNQTKVIEALNVQDQQLARLQYGVYVDDVDLESINFTNAPDFSINTRNEAGLWVETSDSRYRAYLFVNSANATNREIRLSMKRLTMN